MTGVFCPRCGEGMVIKDGEVTCVPGGMGLSRNMHEGLTEVFISRTRPRRPSKASWRGRWFCPGCGVLMKTDGGHVRCETCGGCLDEFIYALIELHPHRSGQ